MNVLSEDRFDALILARRRTIEILVRAAVAAEDLASTLESRAHASPTRAPILRPQARRARTVARTWRSAFKAAIDLDSLRGGDGRRGRPVTGARRGAIQVARPP